MQSKVCTKCGEMKGLEHYRRRKGGKDGFRSDCKACQAEVSREYYQKNKEAIRAANRKWRKENPEKSDAIYARYRKTEKRRTISREWARENRKQGMKRFVERYNSDPQFNIAIKYRRRVYMAIRNQYTSKATKTIELLGISYKGLKKHIENQFTDNMTWDKLINGEIHIDHIRPCASFDLSSPEQQKECFNYKNLQPLWEKHNIQKGNKLDWSPQDNGITFEPIED